MNPSQFWCFTFFLLLYLPISSSGACWNNHNRSSISGANSLDSTIRDYAFKALIKHHTGVVYTVPLPANLTGMNASVVRMRTRSLWSLGANVSSVGIPPGTIAFPYARRLLVVYQNLGNWSSCYEVPGHSLIAPVIGILAYDASNSTHSNATTELGLRVTRNPISIVFPEVHLPRGLNSTKMVKCARFGSEGSVHFDNMSSSYVCLAKNLGHYAIVVPSQDVPIPPEGKQKKWRIWVIACGSGVVGLVLLCLVWVGISKIVKKNRMDAMRRQAEEGEALESVWVGRSKMPSASMVRTQPVLENGSAP